MTKLKNILNRATIVLMPLLLLVSLLSADEAQPDDIIGLWEIDEDGETVEKIEIYKCGELYCGKIVWLKQIDSTAAPAVDKKNRDKQLRSRPLLELEVLQNYKFDGKNRWEDGKFYAHRKGRTVSPKLTLIDKQHLKIQVKILFVKKSFVWKRVISD